MQRRQHTDEDRRREVLARNDDVVQLLTIARYALETGDVERAAAAVDTALAASRRTISDLAREQAPEGSLAGQLVRISATAL